MLFIISPLENPNIGKDMEQVKLPHISDGNTYCHKNFGYCIALAKLNKCLHSDPGIHAWVHIQEKCAPMSTNRHTYECLQQLSSQKPEKKATQMSKHRRREKWIMIYLYREIPHGNNTEQSCHLQQHKWNSQTWCWMQGVSTECNCDVINTGQ